MSAVLSQRIRSASLAASLLVALALVTAGVQTASAETSDIAWTVQTVDNANGASRANFSYSLDPGAVIDDALLVTNTGTTALPLSIYAADAFTTTTGNLDLLAAGLPSADAGTWITVHTQETILQPGQYVEVPFTLTVPADATPGDHSAGIVSSFISDDPSQSLSVDRRLGSRINVRVSGALSPAASVGPLTVDFVPSLNPFAPGTLVLDYSLTNTGNTRVASTQDVSAAGPLGVLPASTPAEQLPEMTADSVVEIHREIAVPSIGWIGGTVVVTPEGVGIGAAGIEPVTLEFGVVAVPWTLLALFVGVAGVTVLVVVLVRRRAAADAAVVAMVAEERSAA